ncbi:MAG: DUF2817 domain-containing protein [Myxococcota bacterium]
MPDASAFSPDYVSARARFRASALARRADLEHHPIDALGPDGEDLSVDVARIGSPDAQTVVVVSSGLHGMEGYVGSAIQAALLEEALGKWRPPSDCSLMLIHALNPWGMAWGRRVNEGNVDLNRNFLLGDASWRGLPPGYGQVDTVLNPRTPPSAMDPLWPKALWQGLQRGTNSVQAIASQGQYERPKGIFYGGSAPAPTAVLLREQLQRWFGPARSILHLDLHAGIGPRGKYVLVTRHVADAPEMRRLESAFGAETLVPMPDEGTSVRGEMVPWLAQHLGSDRYEGLVVEFGTVGPMKLLEALRDENRAHHHAEPDHPSAERAREKLQRALNPIDPRWRTRVVKHGVRLVQRALQVQLGATMSD